MGLVGRLGAKHAPHPVPLGQGLVGRGRDLVWDGQLARGFLDRGWERADHAPLLARVPC